MRVTTIVLALMLGAAACGGSEDPATAPAPTDPSASSAAADATPTPEPPDELALADTSPIVIEGDTGVLATPGETIVVDHLVRNTAATARSVGLRVATEADIDVDVSSRSVRVKRDEIAHVETSLTVPDDARVGDVLTYEVVAVNVDDIREKSTTTVQVLVSEASGVRPELGDDSGATATNEQVFVFATADDIDADGDLDLASLRVVAGGWLADQITGTENGVISYVPFANVEGVDVLLYEVCDAEQRCGTGLIDITIGAAG